MDDPEDLKPTITEIFKQFLAELKEHCYVFWLYIAENKFHSLQALHNIKKICEKYLHDC